MGVPGASLARTVLSVPVAGVRRASQVAGAAGTLVAGGPDRRVWAEDGHAHIQVNDLPGDGDGRPGYVRALTGALRRLDGVFPGATRPAPHRLGARTRKPTVERVGEGPAHAVPIGLEGWSSSPRYAFGGRSSVQALPNEASGSFLALSAFTQAGNSLAYQVPVTNLPTPSAIH